VLRGTSGTVDWTEREGYVFESSFAAQGTSGKNGFAAGYQPIGTKKVIHGQQIRSHPKV